MSILLTALTFSWSGWGPLASQTHPKTLWRTGKFNFFSRTEPKFVAGVGSVLEKN